MTKSPLLPIFLIVLVDLLGLTIVLPLLPFYTEKLGATPFVFGMVVSSYAFCQLLSGPVIGRLSDHYGRKPLLLYSQFGSLIGLLMLAGSKVLWMVFLARIIDGLSAGNLSLAQAYISDVTRPQDRAKAFGVIGIAFGIGFAIGPAISGVLSQISYEAPILAAAALSLGSIVATLVLLPKDPPKPGLEPHEVQAEGPAAPAGRRVSIFEPGVYFEYLGRPQLSALLFQFFFFAFAFSTFVSGFALFAQDRFHFDARQVSWFFAYIGVLGIILQGKLLGMIVKRLGERKLVRYGFLFSAIAAAILAFTFKLPLLYLTIGLLSMATGVLRPALTSLITRVADRREQGVVLGISQSLQSIAQIAAPLLGTALIGLHMLGAWALVAVVSCVLGLILGQISKSASNPMIN